MEFYRFLHEQGFGTRKECKQLVENGWVELNGAEETNPRRQIEAADIQSLVVDDEPWQVLQFPLYLILNKPGGHETSHKPTYYPSVFSLLPWQYNNLELNAVGRLDADTTGLLLLTTDGQFIHALTSPKKQVPKVYRVTLKHPVGDTLVEQLLEGIYLKDDDEKIVSQAVDVVDEHTVDLTITQGKYHQVKRMMGAVGNRVEQLHRLRIGELSIDGLAPGEWRHLSKDELAAFGF
jgi:16S rRNA pseudouridine516 synthase